jgi:Spondin_N
MGGSPEEAGGSPAGNGGSSGEAGGSPGGAGGSKPGIGGGSSSGVAGAGPADAPCTGTARYTVRLDATWSKETHPQAYPPGAHISALIGGTHDAEYVAWRLGALASKGIKDMAENGGTSIHRKEVEAAIAGGTAGVVVAGQGLTAPGTDTATFEVDADHPLVSVSGMLAPTPDWFTGIDSANLCHEGAWVAELVFDALVYDAGTKSGEALDYSGSPTSDPIALRDFGLFAGKTKVGTFRFAQTP